MAAIADRIEKSRVLLTVIDMQEPFRRHIHGMACVIANCSRLMRFCDRLDLPVTVTEHYPAKLGRTVPELAALHRGREVVEKIHFSCAGDPGFMSRLEGSRRDQVVLCGIESHICVYQTALDLKREGYQVILAADAVSSRRTSDRVLGIARMRDAGVQVMSAEMIMFEILRVARTEDFKAVADILKESPEPPRRAP